MLILHWLLALETKCSPTCNYISSFQPSKGPHQLKVVQATHAVHGHWPLARALGQGKERRWKGTSQKQKEKVNEAKVQRWGRKREKIGSEGSDRKKRKEKNDFS